MKISLGLCVFCVICALGGLIMCFHMMKVAGGMPFGALITNMRPGRSSLPGAILEAIIAAPLVAIALIRRPRADGKPGAINAVLWGLGGLGFALTLLGVAYELLVVKMVERSMGHPVALAVKAPSFAEASWELVPGSILAALIFGAIYLHQRRRPSHEKAAAAF